MAALVAAFAGSPAATPAGREADAVPLVCRPMLRLLLGTGSGAPCHREWLRVMSARSDPEARGPATAAIGRPARAAP